MKYETLTFDEALEKHLRVMDQTAYALCLDGKMPVVVFDMSEPGNLERLLLHGGKTGTLVTP